MPQSDAEKSPSSSQYSFLNPFANHSYFTLRALCQHGPVYLFCPPLQIQILQGVWNCESLDLASPPLRSRVCSFLAITFFCFFKLHILTEATYLKLFRLLSILYLRRIYPFPVLVYYQDYLAETLSKHFPRSSRICELIINSNPLQPNYHSTLRAIDHSTNVVIPTPVMKQLCDRSGRQPLIAPYGGDKIDYLSPIQFNFPGFSPSSFPAVLSKSSSVNRLKIVARSPSHRKGLDLLLHSLLSVDSWLSSTRTFAELHVILCGQIIEAPMRDLFSSISDYLMPRGSIYLTSAQFSTTQYLGLLAGCDFFIMPSRLESSSLAALEALWLCVPSILTEACGISQFISARHGLLLEDLTPSSLSDLIQQFVQSPHFLLSCRKNLNADRTLFTWQQYFNSYSSLLQAL